VSQLLSVAEATGETLGEPDWLTRFRLKSLEMYRALPVERSTLYLRHHEAPEIEEDRLAEMVRLKGDRPIPQRFMPLTEAENEPVAVHVGSFLAHINLPERLAKRGVEFMSLPEAIRRSPERFREIFSEKSVSYDLDKFAALNNSLFSSGVFVHIPDNVEVDSTFRVVWVLDESGEAQFGQTVVMVGANSSVSLTEETYGPVRGSGGLMSLIAELRLAEGARARYASLQDLGPETAFLSNRKVSAGKDSSASWAAALIGGSVTKLRVDSQLEGDGSRVKDLEVVFGGASQRFDVTANLLHRGSGTQGRILVKGVVKDSAKSLLKGIIGIEPKSKNASSYLAEHAMILSPDARAHAIPGLEIESNEVKATHSASVAQIDPEHVYYLMARGIPENEARKMIAMGFFEPVISEIDVSEVRWSIRYLLERKWLSPREAEELTPEQLVDLYVEPEEAGRSVEDIFGRHYKYR